MTLKELVCVDPGQQDAALELLARHRAECKQGILDKMLALAKKRLSASKATPT